MTAFRLAASLAWVAMLGVADAAAQPSLTPPVQVEGGTVVGTRDGALSSYKGIPFAAPPVLGLRWRPPAPVVSWSGAAHCRSLLGHVPAAAAAEALSLLSG